VVEERDRRRHGSAPGDEREQTVENLLAGESRLTTAFIHTDRIAIFRFFNEAKSMKLLGHAQAIVFCSLAPLLGANADGEADSIETLSDILEEIDAMVNDLPPERANKGRLSNYQFLNTADCPEGERVLERSLKAEPSLLAGTKQVDLINVFDADTAPMNHRDSKSQATDGAYADQALVGNSRSIMMWGPYTQLEPGRHLVVYRFKFLDKPKGESACFVDVCHNAFTFSGRRPAAKNIRPLVWNEVAIPVDAPERMKFEFRFWPNGHEVAIDRIYVYKLGSEPGHSVSVMGAVKQTGTYRKQHRDQTVDRLVDAARGNNGLADPEVFKLYRRNGGKIERVKLDRNATRAKTEVRAGDIIWIPEKR
jgi:hypothetical protein